MTDDELLQYILDPSTGFTSPDKLYRRLDGAASREQINRVVTNISSYQTIKDKRPKHYNSIRASFPGDVLQADLMDVSNSATANKGIHFLLTMIDVYSRYAFAAPLKNKNQNTVKVALSSLLHSLPFTPINLTTDDGSEFHNKSVEQLLNSLSIKHWITPANTPNKLAIVERFHRTLRNRLELFTHFTDSARFIDELPELIDNYNHTYHRTIKTTPVEILSGEPSNQIINSVVYDLHEGDTVRRALSKATFDKGATKFSNDLYTITETHNHSYTIANKHGKPLKRRYQGYELRKVDPNSIIHPQPRKGPTKKTTRSTARITRRQKRDPAFNDKNTHQVDDEGNVTLTRRHLRPESSKRQVRRPSRYT